MRTFERIRRVALVLAAAAVFAACTTAQERWESARHADDVASYEAFLRSDGASELAADARTRLAALYAEREWEAAQRTDTVAAYDAFLHRHESSSRAAEASTRRDALVAEQAWEAARELDTIEAYEDLLRRWPAGPHADAARARVDLLRAHLDGWLRVVARATPEAFREYAAANPDGPYAAKCAEAAEDLSGRDLFDPALARKVEIGPRGSGIRTVTVRMRRLVAYPIVVRIPVGTFFVAANTASQSMVVTQSQDVRILSDGWIDVSVPAACANRPRHIPGAGDAFSIQRAPHQEELVRLMPVLERAGAGFEVRQAAVWIVTDDASWSDLGILVARPVGQALGGRRVIGEADAARALRICADAGVDVRRKRLWADRALLLRAVQDAALKSWLESGP